MFLCCGTPSMLVKFVPHVIVSSSVMHKWKNAAACSGTLPVENVERCNKVKLGVYVWKMYMWRTGFATNNLTCSKIISESPDFEFYHVVNMTYITEILIFRFWLHSVLHLLGLNGSLVTLSPQISFLSLIVGSFMSCVSIWYLSLSLPIFSLMFSFQSSHSVSAFSPVCCSVCVCVIVSDCSLLCVLQFVQE